MFLKYLFIIILIVCLVFLVFDYFLVFIDCCGDCYIKEYGIVNVLFFFRSCSMLIIYFSKNFVKFF